MVNRKVEHCAERRRNRRRSNYIIIMLLPIIQNSHNNIKKKSEFIGKQKQKQAKKVQKERIEKI